MEILIAVLVSSIVSALIAKIYVVWAMKQMEKNFSETIEQMGNVSLDFIIQVKKQNNLFLKEVLSRIGKL